MGNFCILIGIIKSLLQMKKLITLCVVVLFALGAKAQLNNWYVGGIAGFSNTSEDDNVNTKTTSWAFGPEVGVGIGENWSVGLVLGMNGRSVKDDVGDQSSSFMLMPDIYGRRWWTVADRLKLFAGLDVMFGTGSMTNYSYPQGVQTEVVTDMSQFGANLNGGIAYSMADRWALLLKLAGVGFNSVDDGGPAENQFWFLADGNVVQPSFQQFLFIGVYYTFLQGGGSSAPPSE